MLRYVNQQLFIEQTSCLELAKTYGTPLYVYSKKHIQAAFLNYQHIFNDFNPLVCYAVKANSNLSILQYLASLGAGFDIVSGGELQRVLLAGGDPDKIIFSGVNKSEDEIKLALTAGILCFNVESLSEIDRIQVVAKELNTVAPISFRVNPNVDAKTHPYISTGLKNNKFGIPYPDALATYLYAQKQSHLSIIGIDCHIGSQLLDLTPLNEAADKIFELVIQLKQKGIHLKHIDLGGGIGIPYKKDDPNPNYEDYARHITPFFQKNNGLQLVLEPGRSIIGNSGILLTKVDFIKHNQEKCFIITDAAMNDLLRPALYDSYHDIVPIVIHENLSTVKADIVGPVCESGDCLGKNRTLAVQAGDYLAVKSAGAYAASMASHYNSRLIAPEILIDGDCHTMIKSRDTFEQVIQNEILFLQKVVK
ncbi:MAG: diaminopimelate decarboxylase [Neisseriaceae bacterium]|nr:MAG: diaminopimelate decarboxylase [Neisseriaceae bacterium]